MIIRENETERGCFLSLYGQLTGDGNEVSLRQAVREHLEKGCDRIVIDLRGLDRMDSAGLGELMACHWRIQRSGGSLHLLTKEPGMVFEILMKVRLDQVFSILGDERDL